jgi:hypothetical protein
MTEQPSAFFDRWCVFFNVLTHCVSPACFGLS